MRCSTRADSYIEPWQVEVRFPANLLENGHTAGALEQFTPLLFSLRLASALFCLPRGNFARGRSGLFNGKVF
jgi:hypothetical protein